MWEFNFFVHSGLKTASFGPVIAEIDSFDSVGIIFNFLVF